ncbi:diguanylate cyclase [Pseudoalteromonas spongiae]|uniref:GGDEF domain-containing response regulator n=1 Tax=Pseudoalteromonas spongiae TaxID=298657 RepID=UPI000C2D4A46|nr:diguanylate cyclase [Pseudoalteromonas spongiae]
MLLNIKPFSECKVLIVDDEELIRLSLSTLLETEFQVDSLGSGRAALAYCEDELPDLVLLDVNLPDMSGLEVCEKLKQQPAFRYIPVVFITSSTDESLQDKCWEVGASDFIFKPIVASTLVHRTKNHLTNKLHLEKLFEYSLKEPLTGLYNRYYLMEEVKNVLAQSKREKRSFSLLMIDIDEFKSYNDHFGHVKGDECLVIIANLIKEELKRPHDVAVRFGGDEFLVVLPYTDYHGIMKVCENLKEKLSDCLLPHPLSPHKTVTLSIGGVLFEKFCFLTLESMMSLADESLYNAKKAGKNCIEVAKI